MQLWSDEIEAMRPEACDAVAHGFALFAETLGRGGTPPKDPFERAQSQRAVYAEDFSPSPDMTDREIAGVGGESAGGWPHGFMAFPCGITTAWRQQTDAWFTRILDA